MRADTWLASLLGDEEGVALVAVGGYGLRRLSPCSDLDVLLVHRGRRDIDDVARRIWYPIWDAGIDLDHSVRTPDEVLTAATGDLAVMLGLLDGRHVAGELALTERVVGRARDQWTKHAKRWMPALATTARARHERFGEIAQLLEPDLKEAKGGLRDTDAIRAVAAALPDLALPETDVVPSRDFVLSARNELHRASERRLDRLLLQHQDEVAARLGLPDADELVREIARAGREISWQLDDALRRAESAIAGPRRRSAARGDRPVDRSLVLRDGEIDLSVNVDVAADASLAFRLAAAAAYTGAPMATPALVRLRDEMSGPGDPWPDDVRNALLALLGGGHAMIPLFETLDRYGLIARAIPEWDAVRSKPQRNAFHRYTVDRHLLEAVAQATRLTRDVVRPDLLLIGALLHDIGKGYPGDHTDAGVTVAADLLVRMGFPPDDVAVVVTLIREHLLLARVATSRDLSDPATIDAVARAVGSAEVADLLAALTEADSIATGPTAWTSWKRELVGQLVLFVHRTLAGEPTTTADAAVEEHARELLEFIGPVPRRALVEMIGERLRVVAADRPGLLSVIVGLLTLHGQSIRSAQAWSSEHGAAIDEFEIEPIFAKELDAARFAEDLEHALEGKLVLDTRIEERARTYLQKATAARPAEPRVIVHDDASERSTVLEVRAGDAVGLLYRLTRTMSRLDLDIHQTKVVTLGHEVVDTFYLRGADGRKLTARAAEEARQALLVELTL